jgi:hypothetical protein
MRGRHPADIDFISVIQRSSHTDRGHGGSARDAMPQLLEGHGYAQWLGHEHRLSRRRLVRVA